MENITLACKQGPLLKGGQGGKKKKRSQDKDISICNRTSYTGMGQTLIEIKHSL